MNYRLIAVQSILLAVLVGVYFGVRRGPAAVRESQTDAPLVGDFPVDRIGAIRIQKGAEVIELRKSKDEKAAEGASGGWIVTSSMGYPAKKAEIGKLFDKIREMKKGRVRATSAELLGQFELDSKREATASFIDSAGRPLVTVRFGKVNFSMAGIWKPRSDPSKDESTTYMRLNDDPTVYEIPGSHSLQTRPADWLDLEIFKTESSKIVQLFLKGGEGEIHLVRQEVAKEPPKDGEAKDPPKDEKPEYEWAIVKDVPGRGKILVKASKWAADSLVNAVASLTGSGVAAPMEIGKDEADVPLEQKKKYGFDNPCLTVGILTGAGDKEEKKILVFGKVKRAKEPKEGGKDEAKEEDVIYAYYPQKRSEFELAMSNLLGSEPVQTAQKVHVYTVETWTYNAIDKKPRELRQEAEEAKDAFLKGIVWDEVEGFTIERGKEKVSVRKRVSAFAMENLGTEIWASEEHWGCPVITARVEALIKELKELKRGDAAIPGTPPKDQGLDEEARTTVALLGPGGKELLRFHAGASKKLDSKEFTWLALPGDDPREAPGTHSFPSDPAAWLDLRVFEFPIESLLLFAVIHGDGSEVNVVRQRSSDGQERWVLRKKVIGRQEFQGIEADQENASNVAALLAHLSARGLEKPVAIPSSQRTVPEEQLAVYGLDRPLLILGVILADRQQLVVHVGKTPTSEDYFAYVPAAKPAWGGGDDPEVLLKVWRLNKFVVEALAKNEEYFRKKEPKKEGEEKKEPGEEEKEGAGEAPGGNGEKPADAPGSGEGNKEGQGSPPEKKGE